MLDAFVDALDLLKLGFSGVNPSAIGRPAYHPSILLNIYVYGYLNRIHSSRRLELETQRNVELMWLTGHQMPDFKTIADFRKNNGKAIRNVCRQFVMHSYWNTAACSTCTIKAQCTTGKERRIKRWEHEDVLEAMQLRLDHDPDKMRLRRNTVEHPFGTLKVWMGYTHFQTVTLDKVSTEMSLHVLAYNMKRVMNIFGVEALIEKIRAYSQRLFSIFAYVISNKRSHAAS